MTSYLNVAMRARKASHHRGTVCEQLIDIMACQLITTDMHIARTEEQVVN